MDELFGEQNSTTTEWLDSMDNQSIGKSGKQLSKYGPKKTTIDRVLDVSPIPQKHYSDMSCESVYDFDSELSFDKSKSGRKYSSKCLQFSPIMRSTPKPSKTQSLRRAKRIRKKSHNNEKSIGLWDKAIVKNPELRQWINSFNEDMKKIESSELNMTQSSISISSIDWTDN